MTLRTLEVAGDQIEVSANIGPGRVVRAVLFIEENESQEWSPDPNELGYSEWEKVFEEMIALSPKNETPADVSRESMYLSDEDIRNGAE